MSEIAANVKRLAAVTVDEDGFVYADAVKICRIDRRRGVLLFFDKIKARSNERGTDQIAVFMPDLARLLEAT